MVASCKIFPQTNPEESLPQKETPCVRSDDWGRLVCVGHTLLLIQNCYSVGLFHKAKAYFVEHLLWMFMINCPWLPTWFHMFCWFIPRNLTCTSLVGLHRSYPRKYAHHMKVSWHVGTPKSSIWKGCSILNHPFWFILGTPIFRKPPYIYNYIYIHILYIYYMLIIISLVSSNCRALQHWGTQDTTEFLSSPMSVVWAKDFVNSWIDSTGNLQENLVKPLPTPRDLGLLLEIPRLLLGVKPATFFYQMWDRLRPHSNDTSKQYDILVTWKHWLYAVIVPWSFPELGF